MPLVSPTTAEHVIGAVEVVVANGGNAEVALVADFLRTSTDRATAALDLAMELGLLAKVGGTYNAASPLCRFTTIPEQKGAVLRLVIEAYRPFSVFREPLKATANPNIAAQETRLLCAIAAEPDEVKTTLVSLGTYSHALVTEGGGNYQLDVGPLENVLQTVAIACADNVAAEARIRNQLGPAAEASLSQHRETVILPLADALIKAKNRDAAGAVQSAGNAVESHITAMAQRMNVNLGTASGIIEKISKFGGNPRHLPRKLIHLGSYLGAIRNAADHGPDGDINNASWQIRVATGLEYVYVACSFISATIASERGDPAEI